MQWNLLTNTHISMQKLFFELLQVAVGQLDCLERGPSPEEWHELFALSQQQRLTGIGYHGVERLFEFGLRGPQDLSIDWMADAETTRMGHVQQSEHLQSLQEKMGAKGIRTTPIGSIGAERHYPDILQELCQPEGIEVVTDSSKERTAKFARLAGEQQPVGGRTFWQLKVWDDTPVRLYYRAAVSRFPLANYQIARWLKRNQRLLFQEQNGTTVTSPTMSAVCLLLRLQQRFLYDRATMRQLLDLYFTLRATGGTFDTFKDGESIQKVLKTFGVNRFARGVMWILQEVLRMDRQYMPCEPLESEGHFILKELMSGRRNVWHLWKHYPFAISTSWIG